MTPPASAAARAAPSFVASAAGGWGGLAAAACRPRVGGAAVARPGPPTALPLGRRVALVASAAALPSPAPAGGSPAPPAPTAAAPTHVAAGRPPSTDAHFTPSPPPPSSPPPTATVRVPTATVVAVVRRLLLRRGTPAVDAPLMAEVLVYAQAAGNAQGLAKLITHGVGSPDAAPAAEDGAAAPPPPPPLVPVAASPVSATLDGTGRSGMVVMAAATDEAIRLARAHGVGIVGTTGTTTGSGAIGYYARRVAAAGLFGLAASGCCPLVAPSGAATALLGTNPLAYGIPVPRCDGGEEGNGNTGDGAYDALVADIGMSAMSYWAVRAAAATGTPLPEHVALDAAGGATVDAASAAALLPFGGPDAAHKASALGVLVEWLTGPAVGATFAGLPWAATAAGARGEGADGEGGGGGWGNLVVAASPSLLRPAADVDADTATLVATLRGGGAVLPGEGGDARRADAARGGVPIEGGLWHALVEAAGGDGS